MKLSAHFSVSELTKSATATRQGIDNTPNAAALSNLRLLCEQILEPVRLHYNIPFSPSSGFRCRSLNRLIGSSDRSQHIKGQAADFEVPTIANKEMAKWIKETLIYDQLILEFYHPDVPKSGWVHVSVKETGNRGQSLIFNGTNYKEF